MVTSIDPTCSTCPTPTIDVSSFAIGRQKLPETLGLGDPNKVSWDNVIQKTPEYSNSSQKEIKDNYSGLARLARITQPSQKTADVHPRFAEDPLKLIQSIINTNRLPQLLNIPRSYMQNMPGMNNFNNITYGSHSQAYSMS